MYIYIYKHICQFVILHSMQCNKNNNDDNINNNNNNNNKAVLFFGFLCSLYVNQ